MKQKTDRIFNAFLATLGYLLVILGLMASFKLTF